LLGDWKSPARYERLPSLPRPERPGSLLLQAPDKANAVYTAALPLALRDDSPDFVPLILADEVLGGGSKSRLSERLRQQDGISYGAGSGLTVSAFEAVGMLKLYAIYAPHNLDKLKTGVREELARLVQDGVTEQELSDAKKSLQEDRKISRAQDASLAAGLASQLNTGRTMVFTEQTDAAIDKTSLAEVNAALRKYIDPAKFLHVYAGDYAGMKAMDKK
jgi:zinc protease